MGVCDGNYENYWSSFLCSVILMICNWDIFTDSRVCV